MLTKRLLVVAASLYLACSGQSQTLPTEPKAPTSPAPIPAPQGVPLPGEFSIIARPDRPLPTVQQIETLGWHISGGGSFLLNAPRFESNPAFTTTTIRSQGPLKPPRTVRQVQEFDYDYAPATRFWLGVESPDGYGIRSRWFHFNQNANTLTAQNPPIALGSPVLAQTIAGTSPLLAIGPQTGLPSVFSLQTQGLPTQPDRLVFDSDLHMDVIDLEGTVSDVQLGRLHLMLAGGLRYARITQFFGSYLTGNTTQYLISEQAFEGFGPTVGVEGRGPLNFLNLSLFGGVRLSLLYGSDRHHVYGTNLGLTPPFTLADHDDTSSRNRFVPAVDLELGLEQTWNIGLASLFLQGSVVGQLWPAGGGAQPNGNMGMIGFAFGAGVRY